jgi:hypothetical protein
MAVLLTVDVQALRLVSKPSDGLLEPLMMSGNEWRPGLMMVVKNSRKRI